MMPCLRGRSLAAEPRSGNELAQLLMEKAAGDEKILLRLIDDEDIPDDGLGFHAQQAVEKMLKAVLARNEVSYERTHNICVSAHPAGRRKHSEARTGSRSSEPESLGRRAALCAPARSHSQSKRNADSGRADQGLGRCAAGNRIGARGRPRNRRQFVVETWPLTNHLPKIPTPRSRQFASALAPSRGPGLTSKPSTGRPARRMVIRVYAVRNPAPIAQLDRATPS